MKRLLFSIGLCAGLLFLITNCSSSKISKPLPTSAPKTEAIIEKPIEPIDNEIYNLLPKSERKNFFPETALENTLGR